MGSAHITEFLDSLMEREEISNPEVAEEFEKIRTLEKKERGLVG